MKYNDELTVLFQNEEFKAKAAGLTTAEELKDLFASYGVEMSLDEVVDLCAAIAQKMEADEATDGELTEDNLEDVSGGSIALIALGVACVGAVALGIYNGYKGAKPKHT